MYIRVVIENRVVQLNIMEYKNNLLKYALRNVVGIVK